MYNHPRLLPCDSLSGGLSLPLSSLADIMALKKHLMFCFVTSFLFKNKFCKCHLYNKLQMEKRSDKIIKPCIQIRKTKHVPLYFPSAPVTVVLKLSRAPSLVSGWWGKMARWHLHPHESGLVSCSQISFQTWREQIAKRSKHSQQSIQDLLILCLFDTGDGH